ncbi:unnamed protein product [Closterium sp. Naga37s-1]|nr:unnamed protein product [Closterium sp. Naga37s-1]
MGVAWNRLKKFAPQALLLLVILQVPLFSITISNRQVDSPIAVVITQLCHPVWLPPVLLSAVVYPGEVARHVGAALLDGDVEAALRLPAWQSVLEQYERPFDGPEDPTDPGLPLLRLELVVGSYFAVGGAIAAQFRAARMPLLGYLLLLWGLLRPILLPHTYPDPSKVQPPSIQPSFLIGLLLAFLCLPGEGSSSKKKLKQATIKAGSDAAKAEKKTEGIFVGLMGLIFSAVLETTLGSRFREGEASGCVFERP